MLTPLFLKIPSTQIKNYSIDNYFPLIIFFYLVPEKELPLKLLNFNAPTIQKVKNLITLNGFSGIDNILLKQTEITFWNYLHENFFFSQIFKDRTFIKNINAQSIIPTYILPYIMYSAKTISWRRYKVTHSNEIIEILFISLWLKNTNLFMRWVRKFFEKNDLKKHKKLFLLMNSILGKLIWGFNLFLRLKGLKFTMRGKFGKAGSVRKSRRYVKRGKCTHTSKNIAMTTQTKVIRTLTGVFSLKLELFF